MQFDGSPTARSCRCPKPSVDTGAGLERNLAVLQGVESVWDIDVFRPLIAAAEQVTGVAYGGFPGTASDVSLRILAEHARTMTFLVADGVVPVERGARLRAAPDHPPRGPPRVPPRCARPRHAGARRRDRRGHGRRVPRARRAARARANVIVARRSGSARRSNGASTSSTTSSDAATSAATTRSSCTTRSASRSTSPARSRRSAAARSTSRASTRAWPSSAAGPRRRTRPRAGHGRAASSSTASCSTSSDRPSSPAARSTRPRGEGARARRDWGAARSGRRRRSTSFLDRTPFYAESGGQVGDTGTIDGQRRRRSPGAARHAVRDAGLARRPPMRGRGGVMVESDEVVAAIDGERRDAIRRNHTATHVLHWALREVLGPHVKQAGFLRRTRPAAVRLQPLRGGHPGRARPDRGARQPRDHHRRAGPPLRDHEGPRREPRCDRVLRRQVRRSRAGARGRRALDRAVRRHPRARARLHRPDQDRERGLDRRQPPPHRGGHRRGRARAHPRRGGAAAGAARSSRSARRAAGPSRRAARAGEGPRRRLGQQARDGGADAETSWPKRSTV